MQYCDLCASELKVPTTNVANIIMYSKYDTHSFLICKEHAKEIYKLLCKDDEYE